MFVNHTIKRWVVQLPAKYFLDRFSKQFLVAKYLFLFLFIEARSQDCGCDR